VLVASGDVSTLAPDLEIELPYQHESSYLDNQRQDILEDGINIGNLRLNTLNPVLGRFSAAATAISKLYNLQVSNGAQPCCLVYRMRPFGLISR
jgi:hypothetical protein